MMLNQHFTSIIHSMLRELREAARRLKTEVAVLRIAYADKRTPFVARLLIGLTVAYLLSPIDLIPDFIPVLGLLDDLLLVPFLIRLSIRALPAEVIADARQEIQHKQTAKTPQKSWVGAAVIIGIWALAIWGCWHLMHSLSQGKQP